jgi:hypothetical protein
VVGILACVLVNAQSPSPSVRGLSHGPALKATYDAILDADFKAADARMAEACDDAAAWCAVMRAVSGWWRIALDPQSRSEDARFSRDVADALALAEAWSEREPQRAEAWFARGAARGARAQWRVLRGQRLAAARDGKKIRSALQRALTLDPELHDAKFGIGLYHYYAAVAPAALRMFRWLLLLPGGNREAGLQQMLDARQQSVVIRGEADYQLHLIYLWYEKRPHDALAIIRDLARRYPHNPLFALVEAEIHDVYFHDAATSAAVLKTVIARAEHAEVNERAIAQRRARAALDALQARAPR